ncbi:hypothetical protein JCM14469_32460 [Desulfatiferula olefinivorans]
MPVFLRLGKPWGKEVVDRFEMVYKISDMSFQIRMGQGDGVETDRSRSRDMGCETGR